MLKDWKNLLANKTYLLSFICLFILMIAWLKLCSVFLLYNESRTGGLIINDFVLNRITPIDVSVPLFIINWLGIFSGMLLCIRTPKRAMALFAAVISLIILRSITMYLVPLVPPEGIIPLRDSFLECSFYGDKVLLRDLFFSGHTASLVLLFFMVDLKPVKYLIGIAAIIVGALLLLQHVHYTIDVIAAPFLLI